MTHMKTTIELPDELLMEAKAVAARRRITLKAMIEHALKREIRFPEGASPADPSFEVNEYGFPTFKKKGGQVVTSEMIYEMMEELGI